MDRANSNFPFPFATRPHPSFHTATTSRAHSAQRLLGAARPGAAKTLLRKDGVRDVVSATEAPELTYNFCTLTDVFDIGPSAWYLLVKARLRAQVGPQQELQAWDAASSSHDIGEVVLGARSPRICPFTSQ